MKKISMISGCLLPLLFFLTMLVLSSGQASAGEEQSGKPSERDKCPVCGMFVAKYPDFLGRIIFADGSQAWFDGVKDMMKYYFNLPKYHPGKKTDDIKTIWVADYYSLKLLDGLKAFYVMGSDVYGPMGRELIPFAEEAAAKEFLRDHKGQAVLTFSQITPVIVQGLD